MKNMKWLALALGCCLIVPAAMGEALVTQGSHEIAIGGKLDFQSGSGTAFNLDLRFAYFVIDRLSVGSRVTFGNNDFENHFSGGLLSEYNFRLPAGFRPLFGTDLVPYVGALLDYRQAHFSGLDDESAIVLGGEAGLKFFLTDASAITLSLVGELASEDVYVDDEEVTDKDLNMQIGMRFYF